MSPQYLNSYVTVPQACRTLVPGITPYSLHRACETGLIPYLMSGRVKKVKRGDVLAWEKRQREGNEGAPPELATVGGFDPLRD